MRSLIRPSSLLLGLALAATTLHAHPISVSFAEIKIENHQVRWRLHLPLQDMDQFGFGIAEGTGEGVTKAVHTYLNSRVKVFHDGRQLSGVFGTLGRWKDTEGNWYAETTATFPLPDEGLQHLTLVCDLLSGCSLA